VNRRSFITVFGGTAVAWPLAARAQQPKLPTIGFLARHRPQRGAHGSRLGHGGCANSAGSRGRTVAIEYRWAEGRNERFTEIANEFVRLKVDAIVTSGAGAAAAKQVTSLIPIVFDIAEEGLIGALKWP
jgi:putative ABC transport system substrate-binding protein